MYLAVSLRGNSQGVLGNLPSYDQRNYDALCKALQQRFAITNQTYILRTPLHERKQKAVDTLLELGQGIRRMTILAYPTATVDLKRNTDKRTVRRCPERSDMGLRIQARPVQMNDADGHVDEIQAFQTADKKIQGSRGYVRAAEKDISDVKDSYTKKYYPH